MLWINCLFKSLLALALFRHFDFVNASTQKANFNIIKQNKV